MRPENFPKMGTLRITSLMGQARSRKTQEDKCMVSILKELKLNTGNSINLQNSRITYISTTGKVLREGSHFSLFLDAFVDMISEDGDIKISCNPI